MRDKILTGLDKINFQLIKDDKELFVSYVMYNHYHECVSFPAEWRAPKYFRILLKQIIPYL